MSTRDAKGAGEEVAKRGRGRPAAVKPKRTLISFRIDDDVREALQAYLDGLDVTGLGLSDAARDLMVKGLRREGKLK